MDKIIGVTGYKGRLGSVLVKKPNFIALDCDITNPTSIASVIKASTPDIIINCAAFTDVDEAERQYTHVLSINDYGVMNIRDAFEGWLIQISTDYIFGGVQGPYSEKFNVDEDFTKGKYGRSKAYGEQHVFSYPDRFGTIIRTTMLYGTLGYPDFVTHILDRLKMGTPFDVPYTLMGSPTYVPYLVDGIDNLIEHHWHNPPPIVNIVGSDVISRYDFALMIASVWGCDKSLINPVRDFKGKDIRPSKAGLKTHLAKKLKVPIYSVIDGLEEYRKYYE